ncbi:hypothetical protein GEMRC1_003572 [Eukaryota sp. GEM-RC1]
MTLKFKKDDKNSRDVFVQTEEDQPPTSVAELFRPYLTTIRSALAVQEVLVCDLACTHCLLPPMSSHKTSFEGFSLKCGHLVCGSCLSKIFAKKNSVQCNQCGFVSSRESLCPCTPVNSACARIDALSDIGRLRKLLDELLTQRKIYLGLLSKRPLIKTDQCLVNLI